MPAVLVVAAFAACKAFASSDEGPSDGDAGPSDGDAGSDAAADGSVAADAGDAAPVKRFCDGPGAGAFFCDDFDDGPSIATTWIQELGGAATATLQSNAASPPRSLLLTASGTPAGGPNCSDGSALLKLPVGFGRSTRRVRFLAKLSVDGEDGGALPGRAHGGPIVTLAASTSPPYCAFYVTWTSGQPQIFVDRVNDAGTSYGQSPLPFLLPSAVQPREWHAFDVTVELVDGGTAIAAAVDGWPKQGPQVVTGCTYGTLSQIAVQTRCASASSRVGIDDFAIFLE